MHWLLLLTLGAEGKTPTVEYGDCIWSEGQHTVIVAELSHPEGRYDVRPGLWAEVLGRHQREHGWPSLGVEPVTAPSRCVPGALMELAVAAEESVGLGNEFIALRIAVALEFNGQRERGIALLERVHLNFLQAAPATKEGLISFVNGLVQRELAEMTMRAKQYERARSLLESFVPYTASGCATARHNQLLFKDRSLAYCYVELGQWDEVVALYHKHWSPGFYGTSQFFRRRLVDLARNNGEHNPDQVVNEALGRWDIPPSYR